jgi:hypothetical protein
MGLPKEVQNLLILTFAAQTNRTFYLHTIPLEPTLKDIDNRCELREQKLPDESQWQLAVQRADSVFGVQISPLRKVNNVADLESKVTQRAVVARDATDNYAQNLRTCLDRFALDPESDRNKTATAALVLVEQIGSNQSNDIVKILAEATIATTEAAMKECLSKASTLAAALEQTSWEIFESIADLIDDRKSSADELRKTVEQALCSDEYVIPLSSTLKIAQTKAVRLLTKPNPTPPPTPLSPGRDVDSEDKSAPKPELLPPEPKPIQKHGKRVVSRGIQENLEMNTAQGLLSELTQNLQAEQTIRLSISWIVEEGSTE